MVSFFCEHCRKDTTFFSITMALQITGVCRSTVYYWMENSWVHWCELPSGRRVICQESLVRQAPKSHASSRFSTKNYSESVQSGSLTPDWPLHIVRGVSGFRRQANTKEGRCTLTRNVGS